MKNKLLIILIMSFSFVFAQKSKRIEETFKVKSNQSVYLKTTSGLKVTILGWDKNEVKLDLELSVESTDEELESEYVQKFHVNEINSEDELFIEFSEIDEQNTWSIFDLFRGKIHFSFDREITGKIYVPNNNRISAEIKYSELKIENIKSEFNLTGKGNSLSIYSLQNLQNISNKYGETEIRNSKGNLNLDAKSSDVEILNFVGNMDLDLPYSEISLKNIEGKLTLDSKSSNIEVIDFKGDLQIDSKYSEINVKNIIGKVDLNSKSAAINIENVSNLDIDSPYSEIEIKNINMEKLNINDTLTVFTKSGSTNFTNINLPISIDDGYSSMRFDNIVGDIILKSKSSSINAKHLKGNWKSKTEYTSIEIKDLSAQNIFLTNRSDDIKMEIASKIDNVKIENEYGNVKLILPSSTSGVFNLSSKHGEIKTDFNLKIEEESSKNTVNQKLGNGNSNIDITVKSADIIIKKGL